MKYAVLSLFLFAGLLPLGRCNKLLCLQDTIALCEVTLSSVNDICKSGVATCLDNALKACKVDDQEDIKAFLDVMKQICTADTDLNKKFVEHSDCLGRFFDDVATSPCYDEILKATEDLKDPSLEDMLKFMKKLCEVAPKAVTCFYGKVETECTKGARDVLNTVGEPLMKVFKKSCDENAGGGGATGISALSWMLFVTISLLMLIWH